MRVAETGHTTNFRHPHEPGRRPSQPTPTERTSQCVPTPRNAEMSEMSTSQKDIQDYKKEWKYWLGGAIIFLAIYVFMGVRSQDWGFSWVLVPPAIWALVLIVAPLFSSGKQD